MSKIDVAIVLANKDHPAFKEMAYEMASIAKMPSTDLTFEFLQEILKVSREYLVELLYLKNRLLAEPYSFFDDQDPSS